MKRLETLQQALEASPPSPPDHGSIASICLRRGDGIHELVPEAAISVEDGVIGDRWAAAETRARLSQITLMNATVSGLLAHEHRAGFESGDNFQVTLDLSEQNLPAGTRLRVGTALLEVTIKPHRGCSKFSERFGEAALRWVNLEHNRALRLRGLHCEVIEPGKAKVGDPVIVIRS